MIAHKPCPSIFNVATQHRNSGTKEPQRMSAGRWRERAQQEQACAQQDGDESRADHPPPPEPAHPLFGADAQSRHTAPSSMDVRD